jgi:anti-anti-sigma factor
MNQPARLLGRRRGTELDIRLLGEIDLSNASEVLATIESAVPNDVSALVLDLSETSYMDSAGVQVLFRLVDRLGSRRQRLRLVVPTDAPVRAVLQMMDVPSVVELETSLGEDEG